jgi:hypothetical protein
MPGVPKAPMYGTFQVAFGGSRGDLSFIRWRLIALSKIAINTIYIWKTDPDLPICLEPFDHPRDSTPRGERAAFR